MNPINCVYKGTHLSFNIVRLSSLNYVFVYIPIIKPLSNTEVVKNISIALSLFDTMRLGFELHQTNITKIEYKTNNSLSYYGINALNLTPDAIRIAICNDSVKQGIYEWCCKYYGKPYRIDTSIIRIMDNMSKGG